MPLFERTMRPALSGPGPEILLVSLMLLVTAALLAPGITVSFSSDDYVHLAKNIHFENLGQALAVFGEPDGREYRPLVRLSLWLNHRMGESAIGFHATNVGLHLVCVVLVYLLFRGLECPSRLAAVGTLVFALHPIHSTSIHFVLGRTDLVCAVFYFGALVTMLWHLRSGRMLPWTCSMALFMLSLMSKEMAVSLPLVLVLLVLAWCRGDWRRAVGILWTRVGPFFLVAGIYAVARFVLWTPMEEDVAGYTDFRLTKIAWNYLQWLFALAYPLDLYRARAMLEENPGLFFALAVPLALIVAGAVAGLLGSKLGNLMRDRFLVLGTGWFLVTLLPVMGGEAHRWYLYIPSASLGLIVVALYRQMPAPRRIVLGLMVAAFVMAASVELFRQSLIWNQQSRVSESLYAELESSGIPDLESVALANLPRGYRSAFLFTLDSLEPAMELRFGRAPETRILSYLNLANGTEVVAVPAAGLLGFSLSPDAEAFFEFTPARRRFSGPRTFMVDGWSVRLTELTPGGLVVRYAVERTRADAPPLFYFDGREFHPAETGAIQATTPD